MKLTLIWIIPLFSLLTACGNSDKQKIAHKWRVTSAAWYINPLVDTVEYEIQNKATQELYDEKVYDLREDGTYSTTGGIEAGEGTWETEDNMVVFTATKGESERWYYLGDQIEIMHDKSMNVRLSSDENKCIMLNLLPLPGEVVETDY